jgi:methyltransferase (TIGR00027 family)
MDNDKPSATALLIAKSQLLLAEDSRYSQLVGKAQADYYRSFVEPIINKSWHSGLSNRCWLKFIERISIPGIYLHYVLRKRCIEQVTCELLDKTQIQQVVMIAGGFDPLLAMLSKRHENIVFFELDHPATQQSKRTALNKFQHSKNLTLLPIDLTKQSIVEVLHGTAFSPDKPSLFIAEGITMYLNEQEIERFFQQIQSCTRHENSHFLFTYMNKQLSGSIQFESATWLVDYWLKLKNEVFRWGIATSELAGFLAALGYRLVSVFDADYLAKHYLSDKNIAPARGENICLAKIRC